VAVTVVSTPQGLRGTAIVAERAAVAEAEPDGGADDPNGPDCQDGLLPDGKTPCDGGPAANPTDGGADVATAPAAGQLVLERAALQPVGNDAYAALGFTIKSAGLTMPQTGAVRAIGSLDSAGQFVATSLRTSTSRQARLVGAIQSVRSAPDGSVTLGILGKSVSVAAATPVALAESVEAAAAADADGVICEQTGDQQGDNVGCKPGAP
jgi:hypothetical protein